jgi:hypothetical protein
MPCYTGSVRFPLLSSHPTEVLPRAIVHSFFPTGHHISISAETRAQIQSAGRKLIVLPGYTREEEEGRGGDVPTRLWEIGGASAAVVNRRSAGASIQGTLW